MDAADYGALETVVSAFWKDRPTLVTGATGLLGGWLVRALLEAGADVVCLVRARPARETRPIFHTAIDRVTIEIGDVRDGDRIERVLREHSIDTVCHVAAQAIVGEANRAPAEALDVNVRGTWTVLEACRRSSSVKQIVAASSDKAYGDQESLPTVESAPLLGCHPYDVSKACGDMIARAYAHTYGLPVVVTRCGNFYGGGDLNWNRIVPGTIRSVVEGVRPVIRSDGSSVRDYFYVEDGAAAYLLLAERLAGDRSLAGEAFNFSNELEVTVLELVEMILERLGAMDTTSRGLRADVRNEASAEIQRQSLCAAKARERLDWRPRFGLEEGLDRTIAWYLAHFEREAAQSGGAARPAAVRT